MKTQSRRTVSPGDRGACAHFRSKSNAFHRGTRQRRPAAAGRRRRALWQAAPLPADRMPVAGGRRRRIPGRPCPVAGVLARRLGKPARTRHAHAGGHLFPSRLLRRQFFAGAGLQCRAQRAAGLARHSGDVPDAAGTGRPVRADDRPHFGNPRLRGRRFGPDHWCSTVRAGQPARVALVARASGHARRSCCWTTSRWPRPWRFPTASSST